MIKEFSINAGDWHICTGAVNLKASVAVALIIINFTHINFTYTHINMAEDQQQQPGGDDLPMNELTDQSHGGPGNTLTNRGGGRHVLAFRNSSRNSQPALG